MLKAAILLLFISQRCDSLMHRFHHLHCSQRYQYKLKHSQQHSTLSHDREQLLSDVGFIWDSHAACWQEHFQSLKAFFRRHGNCNVPIDSKEASLNFWCKHQRRQYKRFRAGLSSTMTEERFQKLESLRFDWNPRNLKSS